MREQSRKLGSKAIEVTVWTLKDKKSNFRASAPDQHLVELWVGRCAVLTRSYDDPNDAQEFYNQLIHSVENA